MSGARPSALVVTMVVALALAGCAPKRIAPPTPPAPSTPPALIVLLPDPETGTTGRIQITNEFGSATIDAPRSATHVTAGGPPEPVLTMNDADVQRLFGDALTRRPVGMTGLLVDPRDGIVRADHRRQPRQRLAVQRERVDQPAGARQRVGRKELSPRRIVRVVLERGDRVLFDRVVCLAERIPGGRKRRRELGHLAPLRQTVEEASFFDRPIRRTAAHRDILGLRGRRRIETSHE